jgi:hypothetical protein
MHISIFEHACTSFGLDFGKSRYLDFCELHGSGHWPVDFPVIVGSIKDNVECGVFGRNELA